MTQGFEFVKGICCAHKWQPQSNKPEENGYRCTECKATCIRDEQGKIIEYDCTSDELEKYQGKRAQTQAAFNTSPKDLGRAAVNGARKQRPRDNNRRS